MSWTRSLSEFTINTVTSGMQTRGEVAALPDGGFVVSWASAHDGGYDIYACRYDATGTKVGPDFRVNTELSGRDLQPDVWAYDGGFTVVWHRLDAGDLDVLGRSFDDVSGPTDVFALHDTDAGWQSNVRLSGQVATYTSGTSVYLTELSPGAAATPLLIGADAKENSETRVIQLAGTGNRFVIGYRNADGHEVAHIYDADTGIVSPQILLSTTVYAPDLHALHSGGFVMLASNGDVQATLFDATGTALSVIDVTSDQTRYEVQGDALALSAGGFVVFWTVYLKHGPGLCPALHGYGAGRGHATGIDAGGRRRIGPAAIGGTGRRAAVGDLYGAAGWRGRRHGADPDRRPGTGGWHGGR